MENIHNHKFWLLRVKGTKNHKQGRNRGKEPLPSPSLDMWARERAQAGFTLTLALCLFKIAYQQYIVIFPWH